MKAFWRWSRRGLAVLVLLLLAWQGWYLGWVLWWKFANPATTSFMSQRLDELREKDPRAELKRQWAPYERISNHLKRAVIAAEDARFSEHEGFDWEGIQKALEKNQKKGRIVAGGSTISQQLAKNLFLSGDKTPWRKAQEAVITLMLEAVMDKRRILEIYLNVVEWGSGVFGAEAAARHYFGIPAAQLSAEQAARLAVLLPNPRRFGRLPNSPYLAARSQVILGRMNSADIP
ncbi:MAG: monofunctional biosynthetic peptidoglycan transglycosylase [Zoogloeaceae bacterium]|nr:monofunctional biosynthetic peptidoglycan transglycosylase [Zoogloeaceae bacterium]MCK6384564.1 monofunctional biosynthetic peptidoglycan transglycosylase [Rhodocyclaceae bacterium]